MFPNYSFLWLLLFLPTCYLGIIIIFQAASLLFSKLQPVQKPSLLVQLAKPLLPGGPVPIPQCLFWGSCPWDCPQLMLPWPDGSRTRQGVVKRLYFHKQGWVSVTEMPANGEGCSISKKPALTCNRKKMFSCTNQLRAWDGLRTEKSPYQHVPGTCQWLLGLGPAREDRAGIR